MKCNLIKHKYFFQSQFCIAFLHSFQLLFYDCQYPRWSLYFILPNAIFFYYLFSDFYKKAYCEQNQNQFHNKTK